MKICVLIKQVASEDSPLTLNDDKLSLKTDNINFVSNEPDNYALEEALLLKEKNDASVTVCTLGPESSRQVLKDALAKGADNGIFISDEGIDTSSPLNIAKTISAAIKDNNYDLVLSGLQSNDIGFSQVGLLVAEYLNTSHASLVMGTEIINEKSDVKVKLELENGWFQWSELSLPASLTIQSGINSPRYATLKGIMSVKNKEVKEISKNDISISEDSNYTVIEKFTPVKSKETTIIQGSADEITEQLLDVLKNKLRIVS
ncbi:MAG: electron transfer flavoprotein subunit beta [Candidatus Marinimicrobia bacterium]|nr:electron transfer flavoprotein subunit beta [Candidatus Neomarinimicrobiota bacterium]MBS30725.1 electron transfer flavoprotein subunit beta [Candidatus Neomarinimicrobiota bacterium]|tara:strand:+ start:3734 stop:4513 length:780 start_codon:yes stop_codon:yes gene_type:complete